MAYREDINTLYSVTFYEGRKTMKGNITKRHFFAVWKVLGLKIAMQLIVSREPVALGVLVRGIWAQQS